MYITLYNKPRKAAVYSTTVSLVPKEAGDVTLGNHLSHSQRTNEPFVIKTKLKKGNLKKLILKVNIFCLLKIG